MNLSTVNLLRGLLSELFLNHDRNRTSPHHWCRFKPHTNRDVPLVVSHPHHVLAPSKILTMYFGAQTLSPDGKFQGKFVRVRHALATSLLMCFGKCRQDMENGGNW
jgi:hypothetical protein